MKQTKKTQNKQTNTKAKEIIMENQEPEQVKTSIVENTTLSDNHPEYCDRLHELAITVTQETDQTQETVVQREYSVGDTFLFDSKEYRVVEVLVDNKVHIKCKTEPFNSIVVDTYAE